MDPRLTSPLLLLQLSFAVLPNSTNSTLSRSRQRLIKVDFSKLQVSQSHTCHMEELYNNRNTLDQDDELNFDDSSISSSNASITAASESHRFTQPKMPPYPIGGYFGSQMRQDSPAMLLRPRRTSKSSYIVI